MQDFPLIMGILNVTPDSFSDGGKFYTTESAISHASSMIEYGAEIIDIGGESSRPNSAPVDELTELNRVLPVIKYLRKQYPSIKLSIDTVKFDVAKAAIDEGVDIINDISGLSYDLRLAELASLYNKELIIMHMLGTPVSMQHNPVYNNIVEDIYYFLRDKISIAKSAGVKKIIIDVGIGFGKTIKHNIELLRNIDKFGTLGCRVLLGISRKSFIGKTLGIASPAERDAPTALFHALLLNKKIDIIRVHDVKLISMLKRINHLLNGMDINLQM